MVQESTGPIPAVKSEQSVWPVTRVNADEMMFPSVCVCFKGDLNCIAGATSRNGAFIWDVRKGKIITRFNEVTLTHSVK